MQSEVLSQDPLIITFDSGVDDITLQAVAQHNQWQQSLGWDFTSHTSNTTDWRTSSTWYDNEGKFQGVLNELVARASQVSGVPFESRQAESMQLTRYRVGEYYKPHWDHFNLPNVPHVDNDRIATLIWYVNDDFQGGDTYFNNLDIAVTPRRGRCLFFYYPKHVNQNRLIHEGRAVTQGEKIIASIWLRTSSWR